MSMDVKLKCLINQNKILSVKCNNVTFISTYVRKTYFSHYIFSITLR